ncbi:rho GTPase-activating protein 24-like [Terrapene carolina triunguis]|uniref:rho GTPase-activating protein 24-like n=1 Tax=Terrapene triunguis TaxID=2587831 RepID=UPI000CEFC9C5|nr:rho GTPase-activating protein 24-like [Terrapene carolina triunguis]
MHENKLFYNKTERILLQSQQGTSNTGQGSRTGSLCEIMFEENPTSRYLTRSTCPEESQETNTVTSNVLGLQENLGHGPRDNSSEASPTANDFSANSTSVQHHLVSLKKQTSRQKAEYEAKITSLEQRNKELQSEIKGLHSKLGQQRKWYSLVEIKMRNAERAREDAERRNEMLQREMEEFFDTFGELTNDVKKTERKLFKVFKSIN